jgi:hypothetical protein
MGMIPLNESQRTYFANLTIFDHATTAILAAINIAAVIFFSSVFAKLPYR